MTGKAVSRKDRRSNFSNIFKDISYILKHLDEECGTRFEHECYDLGHLYNLAHFVDRGLVSGQLAKSYAEQVTKIRGILEALGLQIATPQEARRTLALKGADLVGF